RSTSALSDVQRVLAAEGVLDVHIGASNELGTPVTVVSPDRVGLLHTVAGVFGVHRLVVRSAFTETIGTSAVTVWTVSPEFGSPPDAALLRSDILRVLDGRLDLAER